jgi:hypothetical protein
VDERPEVVFYFRTEKTPFKSDMYRQNQEIVGLIRKIFSSKPVKKSYFSLVLFSCDLHLHDDGHVPAENAGIISAEAKSAIGQKNVSAEPVKGFDAFRKT